MENKIEQAPLELVGLGSSSSMDSFASWKMNDSGMEKEQREETPLSLWFSPLIQDQVQDSPLSVCLGVIRHVKHEGHAQSVTI